MYSAYITTLIRVFEREEPLLENRIPAGYLALLGKRPL